MAEIGTTPTSYRKFINEFRTAFRTSQPFQATYGTTTFDYVVVTAPGSVDNLYLTSITVTGSGVKNLTAAEVGYGHGAVGNITTQSYTNALARNYVTNWDKAAFDIVLLCTVEAARSKFIYKQVADMLNKGMTIKGDDLKAIAQSYGQTQSSVNMTDFRPLSNVDYVAHYKEISPTGSVKAQKFAELFL